MSRSKALRLDGALKLEAKPGAHLLVRTGGDWICNGGHVVEAAGKEVTEEIQMRGYVILCLEVEEQIAIASDVIVYDGKTLEPVSP